MMSPSDCVPVAKSSFLRRRAGWRSSKRGKERGCGLKGQQAGNARGAEIAQAPGKLLSFSLWYTSLKHLRARGAKLGGTG